MHICFTPPCFGISSCVPNAVLTFDDRTAYVRALQPIEKDEEVRKTPLPCALIILCLTCIACFRSVFPLCHCYPSGQCQLCICCQVSISYIETAAVTKKRQNDLKQYFFTCTCPRCVKVFHFACPLFSISSIEN